MFGYSCPLPYRLLFLLTSTLRTPLALLFLPTKPGFSFGYDTSRSREANRVIDPH